MSRHRRVTERPGAATVVASAAVLASAALLLAACGGGTSTPATTTEAPPATSAAGVAALTAGPPSRYRTIEVAAGSRRAAVPASLADGLAPLLIARDFGPQASLADYGLDHPSAIVTYESAAGAFTVSVGQPNFDRSGFYAMRSDHPSVYLVLAGPVKPVLALVGISG